MLYNGETYPRKCFWAEEKETWIKIKFRVSANRPSNDWVQDSDESIISIQLGFRDCSCLLSDNITIFVFCCRAWEIIGLSRMLPCAPLGAWR